MRHISILLEQYAISDEDKDLAVVLKGLVSLLSDSSQPMVKRLPPVQVAYLFFFDGGSRGNPGPGGSGSTILQVDVDMGRAGIVWVASMSYSHSTTINNMAEYCGLLHDLRLSMSSEAAA
uniref:RNase H type-1 domain-containing protein n=1 Tax=Globisporangium ultimum (strain ATCC 200006 / CBS 805.95 / DAOM BR144) TaxID=431595 RepID=K3WLV5_GLOUD